MMDFGFILFATGFIVILLGLYSPAKRYPVVAYGMATSGFCTTYLACYQLYAFRNILSQNTFISSMLIITLAAFIVAVRQRNQLLAAIAIFVAVAFPSLFLNLIFDKQLLAVYLIIILAFVLLLSYAMHWLALNIVSVLGYLLYNPFLFQTTALEPQAGLLSTNELLWIFGSVFIIFTIIPIIYTLTEKKERLFESFFITLVGAYTFTMIQFIIEHHLQMIKELPFFLRFFIHDLPTMADFHLQMFFTSLVIYGSLLFIVLFTAKRSKILIATLANLCCLSLFGVLYVHSFTAELIRYLVWVHNLVIDMLV